MMIEFLPSNHFYLNVELVAPKELQDLVIEIQKSLFLPGDIDYLPGKTCPVHLTLYSTYSSRKAIDTMTDALKDVAARYKPVHVGIDGPGCFPDGSIFLKCERSPNLIALHRDIVTNLSRLRDVREPPPELLKELSEEQVGRFREFGDPFCLDNFIPHVTIVTIEDYAEAVELSKNIREVQCGVTFSKIAVRIWESEGPARAMLLSEQVLK